MTLPKFEIEKKINPATILALAIAVVSIVAGFAQARADINDTRARTIDNGQRLDRLIEVENMAQVNSATTNQILRDHERRITKIEDK